MTIFTDTGTISSKTTPSSVQNFSSVDSNTLLSITSPSIVEDVFPSEDTDTPFTLTDISSSTDDYLHPTGFWGPFDDDSGAL